MTTNMIALASTETLRNAELDDLVSILQAQADVRYDVVVNAAALRYEEGLVVIDGGALRIDDEGVQPADAKLRPTLGCEDQFGDKLGIPTKYLRKMREAALAEEAAQAAADDGNVAPWWNRGVDLLDRNVNHWLAQDPTRKFLLRAFRTDEPDEIGVARALLSDSYKTIDNLDVLVAALAGARSVNENIVIDRCDLSERRMQVRISAPEVTALAPLWLKGYRSPFDEDGGSGNMERWRNVAQRERLAFEHGAEPIVSASIVLTNGETGGSSFEIAPQVVVQICRNGLTITADAMRAIHLGGRLDEGIVQWSSDTQQKALELVTAKAHDAVATFLDADYLQKVVDRIEEKCGAPVKEPTKIVERVGKQFGFSKAEQDSILSAFIASGQSNAGGVMQAVTAAAQTIEDADRAADLEALGMDVLDFVASAA